MFSLYAFSNVWIIRILFRKMFVYYSHSIWMRTLYLPFIHIICVRYLDYSSHKMQTLLLPDLMAGPWVDLGFLTGVGAVPDCFSFIFLLSRSSFYVSVLLQPLASSPSFSHHPHWPLSPCDHHVLEGRKKMLKHFIYIMFIKKNKCNRLKIYHAMKP